MNLVLGTSARMKNPSILNSEKLPPKFKRGRESPRMSQMVASPPVEALVSVGGTSRFSHREAAGGVDHMGHAH